MGLYLQKAPPGRRRNSCRETAAQRWANSISWDLVLCHTLYLECVVLFAQKCHGPTSGLRHWGKVILSIPPAAFSREELGHMELVCLENAGAGDLEREELAPCFMLQVSLFPLSFPVYSLSHPRVLGCVSLERCSYHDQAPHKVLAS